MAEDPSSVVQFWRDAGPKMWFAKDADFDRRRFGRFPHRNTILGRTTTAEEQRYLDEGGYKG